MTSAVEFNPKSACLLCGSSNLRLYLPLRMSRSIYTCQNCTNAFTLPEPVASYDDHQFFTLAKLDQARWRSYSLRIVRFIQRNFGTIGRLLDVGCSHGLLIEEAEKLGFDAEGIEPSKSAAAYCQSQGLKVQRGYLTETLFPQNSFDVIVMAHVIEHTSDPARLLRIAHDILKPSGVLCLSQTNYQGTLPRWLGPYWGYWAEHEHYYHFSPRGINYMLQRTGFQETALELSPLGYDLHLKIKNLRDISRAVLSIFNCVVSRFRIGMPFQGDQMYILARPAN